MTWKQRHHFRAFVTNTLWFGPVLAMLSVLIVAPLLRALDRQFAPSLLNFLPDAARTLLGVLLASILTFITFLFSSLLLVVQLASAQLTPRVIARAFNDRSVRFVATILVFFFTLSLSVLANVRDTVPQLSLAVCAYGSLVCVALFLYLVDRVGRLVRPVTVLTSIGREARLLIESYYPTLLGESGHRRAEPSIIESLPAPEVVANLDNVGVLLAFDDAGLVKLSPAINDPTTAVLALDQIHHLLRLIGSRREQPLPSPK